MVKGDKSHQYRKNKKKKSGIRKKPEWKNQNRRINIIMTIGALAFLMVVARLFQLQIVLGGTLRDESYAMRQDETVIVAERGSIYDTNEVELAVDASVYSLWVDPNYLRLNLDNSNITKDDAAERIASILGLETDYVLRKLELNSGYVWLKKEVSFDEVESIKNLGITGLYFQEEKSRYYPDHAVGGNLLGFVNKTGVGVAGIEATYNDILKGKDGYESGQKDGQGNYLADTLKVVKEAVPGKSVVLTIDQKAQYIAEREIANIKNDLNPKSAVIMVMETKTGAILASANTNSYDPNNYKDLNSILFTTLEYQSVYEPGSTMKTIMAAAAINENVVEENSGFYDSGSKKIGSHTIKCWIYPRSHGYETLTQGFANSCNPVFVDVSMLLKNKDKDAWYRYLDSFGFGNKSAIGFGGESNGILPSGSGDIYHATSAIGQGIAVTPIQMLVAISAVANDGQKMKPYLVKEIRYKTGAVVETIEPTIETQIVSKDTAEAVQRMMKAVVDSGTGKSFQLSNGIESMGKTGTAQKVDSSGSYYLGKYVISYIGVAPYDNPKFTVLVIIDDAAKNGQSSTTVAPYYKTVMEDILALYSVSNKSNAPIGSDKIILPDLNGMRIEEGIRFLSSLGLIGVADGTGYITAQSQRPYSTIAKGSEIILKAVELPVAENQSIVPNLVGFRLPDAINIAENAGFRIVYNGFGKVVEQSLTAGTAAEKNAIINVRLGE